MKAIEKITSSRIKF